MADIRNIIINPEHLKLAAERPKRSSRGNGAGGGTLRQPQQQQQQQRNHATVKVRAQSSPKNPKSTLAFKKSLVKMIREHEQAAQKARTGRGGGGGDDGSDETWESIAAAAAAASAQTPYDELGDDGESAGSAGIHGQHPDQRGRPAQYADNDSNSNRNSNTESEFQNSLAFLANLSSSVEDTQKEQRTDLTLRTVPTYHPYDTMSTATKEHDALLLRQLQLQQQQQQQVQMQMQPLSAPSIQSPYLCSPTPMLAGGAPGPRYGCLKGGNLPTYRTWVNQTMKQAPPPPPPASAAYPFLHAAPHPHSHLTNSANPALGPPPGHRYPTPPTHVQRQAQTLLQHQVQAMSRTQQLQQLQQQQQQPTAVHPASGHVGGGGGDGGSGSGPFRQSLQRKTLRRTYVLGKRKHNITVLVSNKTLRAKTAQLSADLKNTPIQDVRKYLMRHGLIKMSTNAPADVLRQMYENARLLCGEIKNHNSENMLFNYLNDGGNNGASAHG